MEQIKCITFDKAAQDNLPQDIKDKMKADREKAIKQQENKDLSIPNVMSCKTCQHSVTYSSICLECDAINNNPTKWESIIGDL